MQLNDGKSDWNTNMGAHYVSRHSGALRYTKSRDGLASTPDIGSVLKDHSSTVTRLSVGMIPHSDPFDEMLTLIRTPPFSREFETQTRLVVAVPAELHARLTRSPSRSEGCAMAQGVHLCDSRRNAKHGDCSRRA